MTTSRPRVVAAFLLLLAVLAPGLLAAQASSPRPAGRATVREYKKVIRTYPFSDPNPIPVVGRIYPYFRYDGYTDTPVDREWTVVELENDFLKVTILPEVGGKIWSAIEKSTGRSFIYDNKVVKFRDIAMRGPWTSGGIEPNYGIIGHTPNCATPVDYVTSEHEGQASVTVGVLDLLTRTRWRLIVSLPRDKAYFTTRSYWYNQTPIEQPYYSWMNTGIKAAGNLELIYPGTNYIGHGGELFPWPMHPENGRNLAFYEQNDFGPYKSYHVLGRYSDFFGAYWHDDDFGMGRYSTRDDKLGKKAWIWGLSRQGMIWEKLLTDTDGQYVEVQSGRLFNQAAEQSTFTPFKHRGFEPYSTDTWVEYWFPVKGTRGFVKANERGALNVVLPGTLRPGVGKGAPAVTAKALELRFSPLVAVTDTLEVLDGDRVVFSAPLALKPLETWSQSVDVRVPAERLRVRIGNWLDYRPTGDELSRPLESPKGFDWESVQGLHLKGKEWMRQRDYVQAQSALEACLKKDPDYLPALADLAIVRYRAIDYKGAWDLARRGLAIDTYDPASNYYYGLASVRLGRTVDALDGFEVAAQSPAFRPAALIELAKIHLRKRELAKAWDNAVWAELWNTEALEPRQLRTLLSRLKGETTPASIAASSFSAPESHFDRFERFLVLRDEPSRRLFLDAVRNEMPHETFLEMAAWYHDLGRLDEARQLLEMAPPNDEVLYWLAFVQDDMRDPAAAETLKKADAASPRLVFPFRSESAPVFEWAMGKTSNWRPKYYLALIDWSRNDVARARGLLQQCGDAPDFAPFYAARAKAFETVSRESALADLRRAAVLEPAEWRYGKLLVERQIEDKAFPEALAIAARYAAAAPSNYILGMLHAKTLILNRRFADASALLGRLNVLPYEGSTDARALYREAELMVGASEFAAGRFDAALKRVNAAREWPEHLGAGKPYPADVDERLEDWLEAICLQGQGKPQERRAVVERLAGRGARGGIGQLLSAAALAFTGRSAEGERLFTAWAGQQKDPEVAEWGRRLIAGERPAWPATAPASDELRILVEWLRR
jgi:tetratricopeptide (TPR) repeat protein